MLSPRDPCQLSNPKGWGRREDAEKKGQSWERGWAGELGIGLWWESGTRVPLTPSDWVTLQRRVHFLRGHQGQTLTQVPPRIYGTHLHACLFFWTILLSLLCYDWLNPPIYLSLHLKVAIEKEPWRKYKSPLGHHPVQNQKNSSDGGSEAEISKHFNSLHSGERDLTAHTSQSSLPSCRWIWFLSTSPSTSPVGASSACCNELWVPDQATS